jgi:hypothetical protein
VRAGAQDESECTHARRQWMLALRNNIGTRVLCDICAHHGIDVHVDRARELMQRAPAVPNMDLAASDINSNQQYVLMCCVRGADSFGAQTACQRACYCAVRCAAVSTAAAYRKQHTGVCVRAIVCGVHGGVQVGSNHLSQHTIDHAIISYALVVLTRSHCDHHRAIGAADDVGRVITDDRASQTATS